MKKCSSIFDLGWNGAKLNRPRLSTQSMRPGLVLLAVLVMVAMASMVAASLMFAMHAETAASIGSEYKQQSQAAAMSGLLQAIALLQQNPQDMDLWHDNPEHLQNQFVADDGNNRWYFSVYASNDLDPYNVRFGFQDEAGKININTATESVLLALPNLTNELVDCLLDYRDSDSDTRPQGAEQDYYDSLDHPYIIRNGFFVTLEELLLVKGFDATIIYGEDANRNGLLDPNEDDGDESFPPDNRDGQLDMGLHGLATTFSYEMNIDSSNRPRININDPNRISAAGLPSATVDFIRLYLAEGNVLRHPSELLDMQYELTQDHTLEPMSGGGRGGRGQQGGGGQNDPTHRAGQIVESGVGVEQLPDVLDRLSVLPSGVPQFGLVNVNSAPVEVLRTLPGLDENSAQLIVDIRSTLDPAQRTSIAWLVIEEVLETEQFKQLAPLITGRGFQFHARIVGFGVPCGQFRVIEAVVDLAGGTPQILYLRDLTRLGLPFAINAEEEGL